MDEFIPWSQNAREKFEAILGPAVNSINGQIAYVAESIARDEKSAIVCDYHVIRAIRRELQELFDNQYL
jgi:hypothetical protein